MTQKPELLPYEPFKKGLVDVFTGDGKGKTTAALGVVLRALGYGLKVHIVFFMKGGVSYGEERVLSQFPGLTFARYGRPAFTDPRHVTEEDKAEARAAFEDARKAVLSGEYNLVVLDEVNVAVGFGLLDVEEVLRLVEEKPGHVELILTGRRA